MSVPQQPLVSVVVPAYNAAGTVREALASVAAQGRDDLETIVVDDASRDATPQILREEYAARPGYTVLLQERNAGPAAARNRGVAAARGTWLAFLDGDDAWTAGRLDLQLALAAKHPDVALWCGSTVPLATTGGPRPAGAGTADVPLRDLPLKEFVYHNAVATSTVLMRREAFAATGGFDVQFVGPEDYDLWMRLARTHRLVRIERPLARYRLVPGSLSMDDRKFLPQVLRVLDKGFAPGGAVSAFADLRASAVATQYWNASWMAFNRGARATAVQLWWRAYRLDHRSAVSAARPWGRLLLRYLAGRRETTGIPVGVAMDGAGA